MLKMFRFRRYRVFLVFAVIFTLLLVKLGAPRLGSGSGSGPSFDHVQNDKEAYRKETFDELKPAGLQQPGTAVDIEKLGHENDPDSQTHTGKIPSLQERPPQPVGTSAKGQANQETLGTTSSTLHVALETIIPDRTIADDLDDDEEEDTVLHHKAPSRVEAVSFSVTPTTVHWVKQTEHFPVPTESIIRLPTGKPVSIPKIQHGFSDESNIAKVKREGRQQKVKDEFKRAWNGYKKKAWMHDEIKPVSGEFKDPFNGWAATLVDALDTIYIMGLETEFEEAVQAVGKIDFTTSIRGDIPVFETTIRYLGGLIGAYDISGHKHQILLGKAVELAEVLMGVFDTPNRMPVLNYYWKPDYASQPHRASMRANMAELGSLAMEFTRLAQLTEKPKYYDAVARITNALVEWQERGAPMKGLFPEMIDASGCNRTAVPIPEHVELELAQDDDEVVGYVPPMPETVPEKKPEKKGVPAGSRALEMHVAPAAPGQPERASLNEIIVGDDKKPKTQPGKEQRKKIGKRADAGSAAAQVTPKTIPQSSGNQTSTRVPPAAQIQTGRMEATKTQEEGDGCVEQGLTSGTYGTDQYSMGAGQDSTYEYFAKQWLLLGGLEPKYKKLYLETVDAVRRHMLYRPMVPGDRDILFSGKLYVSDGKIKRFEAEATHLTCFLGGMIGMGSRIFDIPEDLEIAKRLTDGCVWAYEATQTGIMPETAEVVKCEKVNDCHWNETLWYQKLDPLYADREGMIGDYEINKAKMKAQAEADRLAAEAKAKAEAEAKAKAEAEQARLDAEADQDGEHEREHESSKQGLDGNDGSKSPAPAERKDDDENKMDAGTSKTALRKRTPPPKGDGSNPNISQERLRQKMKDTEVELDGVAPGREIDKPSFYVPEASAPGERVFDPERPPTHKEWVEQKLERENLPPGYLRMWGMYILRPEAIESVWYMYRLTGDTKWQDKGWKMFESIINATTSEFGHSAIVSVTEKPPMKQDSMESFWLAETLKYFYLLYSEPGVVSLDEWVLNTEAHTFRRPR